MPRHVSFTRATIRVWSEIPCRALRIVAAAASPDRPPGQLLCQSEALGDWVYPPHGCQSVGATAVEPPLDTVKSWITAGALNKRKSRRPNAAPGGGYALPNGFVRPLRKGSTVRGAARRCLRPAAFSLSLIWRPLWPSRTIVTQNDKKSLPGKQSRTRNYSGGRRAPTHRRKRSPVTSPASRRAT